LSRLAISSIDSPLGAFTSEAGGVVNLSSWFVLPFILLIYAKTGQITI
jgi:hypothetical protein